MTNEQEQFGVCEICGSSSWVLQYSGRVREGVAGVFREGAAVARCGGCGVCRLEEAYCQPDSIYEAADYRALLRRGLDSKEYFVDHDALQIHTLNVAWPLKLRGATVVDVGCGGGSLLDCLRGIASQLIAVEPYGEYRKDLERRGYDAYAYATDATERWAGKVDYAFSIQVIEHTKNPREFLKEIKPLLTRDGTLLVSTPNSKDIMMSLLPDEFPSFFYRTVHRWYFDADSLARCAQGAGYRVICTKYIHRFGLSNAMGWLKDQRPSGDRRLKGIDDTIDSSWKSYLESTGQSDWLFLLLKAEW